MAIILSTFLALVFINFAVIGQDIGTFWQITDIHYDANYSTLQSQDVLCHYWPPGGSTKQNGDFGDYACDAPWTLVASAINAMKLLGPEPDFVIWTGDSIPHTPDAELNPPKVFNLIQNITSQLSEVFSDVPIFPVLGNHDIWPVNQLPAFPGGYYDSILYSSGWNKLLPADAQETFSKGGFYSLRTPHGQRLLGLNTNLYYYHDIASINMTDPALQFMWLKQELASAQKRNEKVLIIGHVPPGTFGRASGVHWFTEPFNQKFLEILQTYSDNILATIFGHEHTDGFRIVYNVEGVPSIPMFLAPAVTPWKSTIIGVGANNPGIRLYQYDRSTGQILDYNQYFLNLTAANEVGHADWLLEYTATEAFDITSINPAELQKTVTDMASKNSDVFNKYYKFNAVSYDGSPECNAACKRAQICAITNISYAAYGICMDNYGEGWWESSHFPADMMHNHGQRIGGHVEEVYDHRGDATPAFIYFVIVGVVLLLSVVMFTVAVLCFRKRNVAVYFGQQQYMPIDA